MCFLLSGGSSGEGTYRVSASICLGTRGDSRGHQQINKIWRQRCSNHLFVEGFASLTSHILPWASQSVQLHPWTEVEVCLLGLSSASFKILDPPLLLASKPLSHVGRDCDMSVVAMTMRGTTSYSVIGLWCSVCHRYRIVIILTCDYGLFTLCRIVTI